MSNFYKKLEEKDRERVYGMAYNRGLRLGLKALTTLQTEVEGLKRNFPIMVTKDGREAMTVDDWKNSGYNAALSDVLSIINKLQEEK